MGWPNPNLAKQSRVFHTMCRHAGVPVGGGVARRELSRGSGARGAGPVWESGSVACTVRIVFSPYLYRCCSCSLLFAVLLNCPYPDPPVSASFFSFSSARWRGEEWLRGAFVAGAAETKTQPQWIYTIKCSLLGVLPIVDVRLSSPVKAVFWWFHHR